MGTNLQKVFDAFFVKIPTVNFTGKESMVAQFLESAIAKCYRHTYDNLTYDYDKDLQEGYFNNEVSSPSVELISMFMAREYYIQRYSLLNSRKQHIGTQAFNKLPDMKTDLDVTTSTLSEWDKNISIFLMDFPDYSDER